MKSLSLSQPHLIVMVGIPGSGKSFFAEKFADTFRAPCVDYARISLLVDSDDKKRIDDLVLYQLTELLKTNQSVIVDGASTTRTERAELSRLARSAGYETLFIWVQTDPVTAKQRSIKDAKDKTSPTLTPEEHDRRVKRFTPPSAMEHTIVISGRHTYASQAKVVLKKLSAPRAAIVSHVATPIRDEQPIGRRNITVR